MFFVNILNNIKKYSFLTKQLVMRDFKVKYKRSVLGVFWSILYPLLTMAVMAVVFSQMFKFQVEGVNYLVYLLTGLVMFNYFSEASSGAMASVVTNFQLINKVYIPKYIFPLSKTLFVGINFLLTLIPLLLMILFTGSGETKCIINIYYLLLPFAYLCLFMFTLGMGFILSTISIFFRDMFYIYGVITMLWTYLTPIFYDITMLDPWVQGLMKLNPLYNFIDFTRVIILHGTMPSAHSFFMCLALSVPVLLIGMIVFKKNQDKFIYYV
ncbi:MAG: ABC transporter permease [Bacilli bacterium]|nr:ABC transporter permease [Bacilli bacterium]MDD3304952.1 ABC transporter permease [Bacilli bacterium]MDD4054064.1 ABC transporter permease [Bacilli bacterium]MDD4411415.1 ABC transporter permease [Bacilli bacterium]